MHLCGEILFSKVSFKNSVLQSPGATNPKFECRGSRPKQNSKWKFSKPLYVRFICQNEFSNRKSRFGDLNFNHSNLFRISSFGFRIFPYGPFYPNNSLYILNLDFDSLKFVRIVKIFSNSFTKGHYSKKCRSLAALLLKMEFRSHSPAKKSFWAQGRRTFSNKISAFFKTWWNCSSVNPAPSPTFWTISSER